MHSGLLCGKQETAGMATASISRLYRRHNRANTFFQAEVLFSSQHTPISRYHLPDQTLSEKAIWDRQQAGPVQNQNISLQSTNSTPMKTQMDSHEKQSKKRNKIGEAS
jgi:hypothetical protein